MISAGDRDCFIGTRYFSGLFFDQRAEADACAAKVGGRAELQCENISDGLPARVIQCYYKIVGPAKPRKAEAKPQPTQQGLNNWL